MSEVYFITIPYFVYNSRLSDAEKIILGLLYSLSSKEGFCYASNSYLAEKLLKSEEAIKQTIKKLKKHGLIRVSDESKKTQTRKIFINDLTKLHQYSKKAYDAITPEPELVEGIIEDEKPVDKYAHFVPEKKAPRATTIINIANVTLTPKMREYAQKKGYDDAQTEYIFEHFLSHHGAKGSEFKNWDLAFNTWLFNQKQYTKKNFSNAHAQARSSSSPTVGERIGLENSLLADHDTFSREMVRRGIHPYMILEKTTTLPQEFSWLGIMTISTLKGGVQKIWYDTRKYNKQQSCDDIITVEVIEHKGENNA